ncbi:MAG: cation:proton antiporter [Planctomycetota bacterium]|nr:cation:proton antiporter [Planctomycetota bacterium]MEE2895397.1 cation:proton antiporter [Planctomycetota bacterium]
MNEGRRRQLKLAGVLALLVGLLFVANGLEPRLVSGVAEVPAGATATAVEDDRAINGFTLALGFLMIGAWLLGELVSAFGLPRVVGYLVFGVLAGPDLLPGVLGVTAPITEGELGLLGRLDPLAISLIALVAGGEIKVSFLRGMLTRIATLLGLQIASILFGVAIVAYLFILPSIESLEGLPTPGAIHLSIAIGLLCVANSPAIVIAMINETRAKGPMCDTSLAATVCKDLILVVLVTILLGFVPVAFATGQSESNAALVKEAIWHLVGSIGFGVVVGVAMHYAAERIERRIDVFIVLGGFAIAFASNALHFEPLLVALVAGFVQANIWPDRSERMFHSIERLLLPVYCVFFATAGARIPIDAVAQLWPIALLLVGTRLLLVWGGTTAGAKLARLDPRARPWMWTAFTPQAGVAIALALELGKALGDRDFVPDLTALLLAAVAMNEIIGPLLMKWGLQRAGETPSSIAGDG